MPFFHQLKGKRLINEKFWHLLINLISLFLLAMGHDKEERTNENSMSEVDKMNAAAEKAAHSKPNQSEACSDIS